MDQSHDWRHLKARAGDVGVQVADHLDMAWRQANLFLGLAQGCRDWTIVTRVHLPAGKSNLSGVVMQVRGALG